MDAAHVSFEARRRADTVAPPPRFDPFWGSAAGAAIAGSVVAVFYWLAGSNHMAGPIGVVTISAFALPYLYLRRQERKNGEAFETYYIRLLELERAREKSWLPPNQIAAANQQARHITVDKAGWTDLRER